MKIAIVGSAPATCDLAPWQDPEVEIWGLAWREHKRATRLFEMHQTWSWTDHGGPTYKEDLKRSGLPVYMREAHPELPNSVKYPMEEVRADLSPKGEEADYFTSSISFILALAIVTRPEEIGIYGCDMTAEDEYAYQRPAMLYLIGIARGRGIKITLPENSPLAKANFVYGEHNGEGAYQKAIGITEEILMKRIKRYETDRQETSVRMNNEIARINTLDGAIGEARGLLEHVRHFNRGGVIEV